MSFFARKKKKDPEELPWLIQKQPEDTLEKERSTENTMSAKSNHHSQKSTLDIVLENQTIQSDKKTNKTESSSGKIKVAKLLLAIGPERAADILQHLQTHEIEDIMSEMSRIHSISVEEKQELLEQFHDTLDTDNQMIVGGREETKRFLLQSLGEEKAGTYLEKLEADDFKDDLKFIECTDSKILAQMLVLEHDQIVAVLLTIIPSNLAAQILRHINHDQRIRITRRLAQVSHIQQRTIKHITKSLKRKILCQSKDNSQAIGGSKALANILSFMNSEEEHEMLAAIEDVELQQSVKSHMYSFEELLNLNQLEMRLLLSEIVDEDLLVSALRASSSEVKEFFFQHISKNRRQDIEEIMEIRGPILQSEIFQARDKIVALARKLDSEGRIRIKKNTEKWI